MDRDTTTSIVEFVILIALVTVVVLAMIGLGNAATTTAAAICPPRFDAITIIIEQRRQTVACVYDDGALVNETVHERSR